MRCGAPTSQDTSSPVTAATALRGPAPLATAAFGSVAKPWPRRASRRPHPGSRACARHSACRSVSAPTTACRSPPTPWAGSHRSPPGGYAWASCRSASHLAHRHSTAALHAGSAPGTPTPPARPAPPGAHHRGSAITAVKSSTHERPHEALDRRTPAAGSEPSPRKMPHTLPPLEYPDRFEMRDVSATGGSRWHHQGVHVSHVGVGAYVGLEDIDEGVWHIDFGPLQLGRCLARHRRIEEASGRRKRRR